MDRLIDGDTGPDPDIAMLATDERPPWSGGGAAYAIPAVLEQVRQHKTTLIFHNTRAQAEIFFHHLWLANEEGLPIAIHHGSLDRAQREKVEAAMTAGQLRAIVCTGSLDLGIDWGDVDLVIQIGAPKNVKRLVQRIGRANHRYNAPSKALLVPANRFEVVECVAALDAVRAGGEVIVHDRIVVHPGNDHADGGRIERAVVVRHGVGERIGAVEICAGSVRQRPVAIVGHHALAADRLLQGHAIDVLHREVRPALGRGPGVVDLGDAGVVHQRQGLLLGLEAGDDLSGVHAQLDDLQRHAPVYGLGLLR